MKIQAADLPDIARDFTAFLGNYWTINPDTTTDGVTHLDGPDGRRAGIRTQRTGTTLQLWVTGYPAPRLPDDADETTRLAHVRHLAERLAPGANYHTVLRLADVEEPAKAILNVFDDLLFPAYDHKPLAVGHRPWLDAAEKAAAVRRDETAEAEEATEPLEAVRPTAPEPSKPEATQQVQPVDPAEPSEKTAPEPAAPNVTAESATPASARRARKTAASETPATPGAKPARSRKTAPAKTARPRTAPTRTKPTPPATDN